MDFLKSLQTFTNSVVKQNFNASIYTGYKTGGKVKYFIIIDRIKDLKDVLEFCRTYSVNYKIIGNGTNILLSDNGFDGAVIKTFNLNKIIIKKDIVSVEAGAKLNDFIRLLALNGYAEYTALSGIPASIGGAIAMNAGAFGKSISDHLIDVSYLTCDGLKVIEAKDCEFGYRKSKFLHKDGTIVKANFRLENFIGAKRAIILVGDFLRKRKIKQPNGKSCGSVFKNPQGYYAGELIEKAGLMGYNINGALVSEKHANFIINEGCATSKDIYSLIKYVKEQVYNKFGVTLQEEIEYLGSF